MGIELEGPKSNRQNQVFKENDEEIVHQPVSFLLPYALVQVNDQRIWSKLEIYYDIWVKLLCVDWSSFGTELWSNICEQVELEGQAQVWRGE